MNAVEVPGKGVPEAVDLGDASRASRRKAKGPGEKPRRVSSIRMGREDAEMNSAGHSDLCPAHLPRRRRRKGGPKLSLSARLNMRVEPGESPPPSWKAQAKHAEAKL